MVKRINIAFLYRFGKYLGFIWSNLSFRSTSMRRKLPILRSRDQICCNYNPIGIIFLPIIVIMFYRVICFDIRRGYLSKRAQYRNPFNLRQLQTFNSLSPSKHIGHCGLSPCTLLRECGEVVSSREQRLVPEAQRRVKDFIALSCTCVVRPLSL